MRIGIITDIHEHLEYATKAIRSLKNLDVDDILCLGDFCETEKRLEEICDLLLRHDIKCVWGNHDFGLCDDIQAGRRTDYPSSVQKFAATVQPKIILEEFYFCHVEPWLDPENLLDLWYYEGEPDSEEKRERIFAEQGWDVAFAGHYHRWLAYTESEKLNWTGETNLDLGRGRHYVVIDACMNGSFALFDTSTRVLSPMSVA